mmetsp:Transcript_67527/g.188430  ORF Transcript_67527/g.188430 Transcript_67527/m.188430 type:complete len:86 (-) Transcript_67527:345-602(-)
MFHRPCPWLLLRLRLPLPQMISRRSQPQLKQSMVTCTCHQLNLQTLSPQQRLGPQQQLMLQQQRLRPLMLQQQSLQPLRPQQQSV